MAFNMTSFHGSDAMPYYAHHPRTVNQTLVSERFQSYIQSGQSYIRSGPSFCT
jgi:hypothetical protein